MEQNDLMIDEDVSKTRLGERIREHIRVLTECRKSDWLDMFESSKISKSDYIQELKSDLAQYYDYGSFFMGTLMEMFPPYSILRVIEGIETPPTGFSIRTNTLKMERASLIPRLEEIGFAVMPLQTWSDVGLEVEIKRDYTGPKLRIRKTPEYLAGHYTVQDHSFFLPVLALDPHKYECVVDMLADSGELTPYLAALMQNTGTIYANVETTTGFRLLSKNLRRMGVTNTKVSQYDVRNSKLPKFSDSVDRVLLDAPCSEIEDISTTKYTRITKSRLEKLARLQKKLLLDAIDLVKVGGFVVYSTGSILVSQNEAVVDYALKHRNVATVPCGLDFGISGYVKFREHRFSPPLAETRRFYTHVHQTEACFVAKLQKKGHNEDDMVDDGDDDAEDDGHDDADDAEDDGHDDADGDDGHDDAEDCGHDDDGTEGALYYPVRA